MRGCTVYAPVPEPKDPKQDRYAPHAGDSAAVAAGAADGARRRPRRSTRNGAATAECVNAQARNRGLVRLLVRGLQKVKAVALWFAIAHNVVCGVRLRGRVALAG